MSRIFEFTDRLIDKLFKNEKINAFLKKIVSREMFDYILFGVLTTVVNLLSLKLLVAAFSTKYLLIINVAAWIISVVFAFFTNKFFVFHSKSTALKVMLYEMLTFAGARVFSLGVEEAGLAAAKYIFHADTAVYSLLGVKISGVMAAKLILAVIVVIMNYIFSKLIIFKNKKKNG